MISGLAAASLALTRRGKILAALIGLGLSMATAGALPGQVVVGGDFDICDFCRNLSANRMRLVGRVGFGTNNGAFEMFNAVDGTQDVDRDGFTPGVHFRNLIISNVSDFRNDARPSQIIAASNLVVQDFLNPLDNGFNQVVNLSVNIPNGTPAGIYRGSLQVRDTVLLPNAVNDNGEQLRIDGFEIEIEVLPDRGLGLVEGDSAATLDSLVIRGRPGETRSGVVRVANLGNVDLSDVRVEATDLVATSGTGLRVRREQITFSPADIRTVGVGDTSRVVVTIRIPLGILGGTYRGDLILQASGVPEQRVPLILIVTTPGGIVFDNNPVRARNGDNAVIIFNADAGTRWSMRIFDMQAITTFAADGTVFPGTPPAPGDDPVGGDEAVRFNWTLRNGRGENVAPGMYLVVIDAIQAGTRRQLRSKLMVIR
jgi:hypothetical protein